jgi:DNA-binding transcriptional MerR regulator
MSHYRIGEIDAKLGLSADTLRYAEKIGLLSGVARNGAGIRLYNDKDLSRLRFIQHAQKMNFTLAEISALLAMREAPQRARKSVRALTEKKFAVVESPLTELVQSRPWSGRDGAGRAVGKRGIES